MQYPSYHILIHHHYFTEQLRNEQFRIYDHDILLIQPDQTRWNSCYFCCYSIMRNKGALRVSCSFTLLYSYAKITNYNFY
jgi:hypothetical protein